MNARERAELTHNAVLHCIYGKWTPAKEAALMLTCHTMNDEFREWAKEALLHDARNNPEALRELAGALCRLKAHKRDKCPRGHNLITAYTLCASFPPTLDEVKERFIAVFGENKWNGGNADDLSRGDFSARETLRLLKLPLKKMKPGRPKGSKSLASGPQGLKEGIARK
jgi:hypothetical protein